MLRHTTKNFLKSLVGLVTIFIFISLLMNNTNTMHSMPSDFYGTSQEATIDEFKAFLNDNEISVYLPTVIPSKLELTAIYLKKSPFIAMVVYSADSNKDYKTAELTIQISIANNVPTNDELSSYIQNPDTETALVINNWPVYVNEKASSGSDSVFRAKYGEYTVLTMLWIEDNQYFINSPTFAIQEVISLVENMYLLKS